MDHIAIDLGGRESQICVRGSDGTILEEKRLPTGRLGAYLSKRSPSRVILETCAKMAALNYVPHLSSHSLRRGMATSAHRAGADFLDIKRQGGWRHDGTVQGYIEEAGRFTENAASALLRRKKSG